MANSYDKINEDKGLLEKIAAKIPGFGGYFEKETRREADKMLRDTIVNRFTEQLNRLSALQVQLISGGGIEYIDDVQGAATRMQRFIDVVKTAAYGYAGLFSAVKVKEDDLAKLYAFDQALLDSSDKVSQAVGNIELAVGSEGLPAAIRNLTSMMTEINDTFDRRKEVFTS